MFGKSSFGRTKFDLTAPYLSLFVNMRANYSTDFPRLMSLVDIGSVGLSADYRADCGLLYALIPIGSTDLGAAFNVSARLWEMVPLGDIPINVDTEVAAPSLKNDQTEEFSLENVLLAPGDTLIIDTDKLEIQVNDVNLLESWVSGGVFFQLKPGTNVIQFDTKPKNCKLTITAFWADRYL